MKKRIIFIAATIFIILLCFFSGVVLGIYIEDKGFESMVETAYYEISDEDYFLTTNYQKKSEPKNFEINGIDIYTVCSELISSSYDSGVIPDVYENNIQYEQFDIMNPRIFSRPKITLDTNMNEVFFFKIEDIKYTDNKAIVDYTYSYYVLDINNYDIIYSSSIETASAPNKIYISFDNSGWKIEMVKRPV